MPLNNSDTRTTFFNGAAVCKLHRLYQNLSNIANWWDSVYDYDFYETVFLITNKYHYSSAFYNGINMSCPANG